MIYCVVPPELGEDAFRRLVEHYRDNPNVKVIMAVSYTHLTLPTKRIV